MKTKKILLQVEWANAVVERVPIMAASGLEIETVDRFLRFMRSRNPNLARYSPPDNRGRQVPVSAQVS